MSILVEVKHTCSLCHGDGTLGNVAPFRVCGKCSGTGQEIKGTVDLTEVENRLKNKLNSIRDEIIEALT